MFRKNLAALAIAIAAVLTLSGLPGMFVYAAQQSIGVPDDSLGQRPIPPTGDVTPQNPETWATALRKTNANFNDLYAGARSFSDSLTANATGTQGAATALPSQVNRVSTAANASAPYSAVLLPTYAAGLRVVVYNDTANPIQVFPATGGKINDGSTNASVIQMPNSVAYYEALDPNAWHTATAGIGYAPGTTLSTQSYQNGMSANSGGVQAGATAITTQISRFTTVGGAGYSAVLPTAAPGLALTVINSGANAMNLFPAGTDAINGLAASAAILVPAGAVVDLYSTVAGAWAAEVFWPGIVNQSYQTASNTTAFTATAAQMATGIVETTLNLTGTLGAGANITTPTAAQIIAAIPGAQVGNSYKLRILNTSGGAFSWTVVAGSGVTLTGTMTIAQNTARDFYVTITNIGTPAVTFQSLGQVAITAL